MGAATWWWILAGVVAAAELLTGGFFLLMLALGLAAGAVAAHAGVGLSAQLASAAVVGGGAVALWAAWRKRQPRIDPTTSTDVLLDVGETVQVHAWGSDGRTTVRHRGVSWQAECVPHAPRRTGPHRIAAVQGNRLVLQPLPQEEGAAERPACAGSAERGG